MANLNFSPEPLKESDVAAIRDKIDVKFKSLAELISAARKPLPHQSGDGSYLIIQPDTPEMIKKIEGTLSDLQHLGVTDVTTLIEVASKAKTGDPWNDKDYLMEKLIATAIKVSRPLRNRQEAHRRLLDHVVE